MMTKISFIVVALLSASLLVAGCKKDKQDFPVTQTPPVTDPPPPPPPPAPVLLKEIVIPNLPSPYYHFEYDASNNVKFASFASDLDRYEVLYENGRIAEQRNSGPANNDRVQFFYDDQGRVNTVKYVDPAGVVRVIVHLSYNGQKLIRLEREKKLGANLIQDKVLTMLYYADGNLEQITYHYLPFNGQPDAVYNDRFEQYDNKTNADGFGILHNEFFDNLILLPGVELQKNNPGKETRTGSAENYTVDYTYTYDGRGRPLTKKGNLLIMSGTNAGQRVETNSFFSYY